MIMLNINSTMEEGVLEKVILEKLRLVPAKDPIRTPDLRKWIKNARKELKFTKKELNTALYNLLYEERIEFVEPKRDSDAPRWRMGKERIVVVKK